MNKTLEYVLANFPLEDMLDEVETNKKQYYAESEKRFAEILSKASAEGVMPKVEKPDDKNDPGKVAQREVFQIAIKYSDPATKRILPLEQAIQIWVDMKKGGTPPQPPGGAAPVAGGGAETPPGGNQPNPVTFRGKDSFAILEAERAAGRIA